MGVLQVKSIITSYGILQMDGADMNVSVSWEQKTKETLETSTVVWVEAVTPVCHEKCFIRPSQSPDRLQERMNRNDG